MGCLFFIFCALGCQGARTTTHTCETGVSTMLANYCIRADGIEAGTGAHKFRSNCPMVHPDLPDRTI